MLPERELSRAVLIGTSDYQNSESLPNLPAVSNNLVDLRAALTDCEVGILGWEQCVVVDSPDSPSSLFNRLRSAANHAQDLLLVYYAGHGIRVGDREELFLTVRQTRKDSPLDTGVPFEWMREVMLESPARTKLLILDCCYSGMALGTMSSGDIDTRQIEVNGTAVIASSPKNSVSHAPVGARYTAFTGELISLLQNGSPLLNEPLTVSELFRSLRAAMARRELPLPKMKSGDTSGDLLLRRYQSPSPTPPVVMEPPPLQVVSPLAEVASEVPVMPSRVVKPVPPTPLTASVIEAADQPVMSVASSHLADPVRLPPPSPPVAAVAPAPDIPFVPLRSVEPDTIRFTPVQMAHAPVPDPVKATKPRVSVASITAVAKVYLLVVGAIVLTFLVDSALGCYIGAMFGTPPPGATGTSDLGFAIGMTVACGVMGGLAVWWFARGGRWVVLEDAVPGVAKWSAVIRMVVVAVFLFLLVLTAFVGLFGAQSSPSQPSSFSTLSINVATELVMIQGAIGCGYSLVRRMRRRRSAVESIVIR